jgi:4-hydroxy-4-methyl-2-oxoglutarate aldolase
MKALKPSLILAILVASGFVWFLAHGAAQVKDPLSTGIFCSTEWTPFRCTLTMRMLSAEACAHCFDFVQRNSGADMTGTGMKFIKAWATVLILSAGVAALLAPIPATAQVFALSREDLMEMTAKNPFDRFPDGRPKIPDLMLERARWLSMEDVLWIAQQGFPNQYADGWQILHPGKKLVGRAFTVQFLPARPDLGDVAAARAKKKGLDRFNNQAVIDMLQPGDVIVVDLFGKKDQGTFVGDNLFYYIMKATNGTGLVVDGAVRDLEGISGMDMPAYFRHAHPTGIGNVILAGWNIPVKIGNTTVMPGDLVVGDREGVYFVPPELVEKMLDRADETHIHDEWTRKKFDEGKYKSLEIYGSPRDPQLKKEYDEYLKKRLEEIRKKK